MLEEQDVEVDTSRVERAYGVEVLDGADVNGQQAMKPATDF